MHQSVSLPPFSNCQTSLHFQPPLLYSSSSSRPLLLHLPMKLHAISHHPSPIFTPYRRLTTDKNIIFHVSNYTHFLKPSLNRFTFLNRVPHSNLKFARCSLGEDRILKPEDAALLVSTCIKRTLAPALTVEEGLKKINVAVEELKAKPSSCSSGMFRFQVAVPPSAKALKWFCCPNESSTVFPQFFLSKEKENPTYKTVALGRTRGVFGIGAAVQFKGSSALEQSTLKSWSLLSREQTYMLAYGFLDTDPDTISSSMKHEICSFDFFIPQIELDEYEDISFLVATLAWHDTSICTFKEAIQKYESSFYQVRNSIWLMSDGSSSKVISSALRKFDMTEDESIHMCQRHRVNNNASFVVDCLNINTLWASLIIEECTRLGLTYFCIAPGSRSSPLAIAASTHPLTTCIACIDERSLAFHAVGYAKGSSKPAVVITSSGTAVSNLLPAVVEASQDFLPVLLLTADRPPELQDVGANQAINQVNHFGSFVKHFFALPPPTDNISARMVLTTLDSAVFMATSSPYGPVHINCPFREPLENSPRKWMSSCLNGLDTWMSSAEPFTSYIRIHCPSSCNYTRVYMAEILNVVRESSRGILLVAALHTEDDIWAALLLAKHLSWPVVVDVLSGLRLRKYMDSFPEVGEHILFLDYLDHLLLSNSVRDWMQADVIVQLGSRITSKRISQMLEHCFPCAYIMVENHPSRHDPSHIVTHRIEGSITQVADCLIKSYTPSICKEWSTFLRALNMMASWEISFLIDSEYPLTEPYVARVVLEALNCESAIFLGNSMPIRDADMYGREWTRCTHGTSMMLNSGLPCHWVQVVGNRGASGIDGLLSTAVGFAAGCNKRVLCLIGDISFLHDTNGLALLRQKIQRRPMTILIINNRGGAIFSLLPLAAVADRSILDKFFYTAHDISVHHLCIGHGVKHVRVQTKQDLRAALITSQLEAVDNVIEVESSIDDNETFHSNLRKFACQAADHAFCSLLKLSTSESISHGCMSCEIAKMEYSRYRIQLCAPPTSVLVKYNFKYNSSHFHREGFIITLSLQDGATGFGEVSPLEIHEENLLDVEEQLQFIVHTLAGSKIDYLLPLLKGSISSWIWDTLGVLPGSIFPSVRCGLEMAILSAIAMSKSSSLLNVLHSRMDASDLQSSDVLVCALIDSNGSPGETAFIASTLVKEGFNTIKLKVARRANPTEDAAVIQEVRRTVGPMVELRVDANRNWTYDEAVQFAKSVENCSLQYVEEPVRNEDDIIKFCNMTGLPVALDETINSIEENPLEVLEKYNHSGIVALVIKPSMIGGFEKASLVARWAQQHGKMAVVSATFESSLGLSAYIQFSRYLDIQNADIHEMMHREPALRVAHGLGTYRWLKEDVTTEPLNISLNSYSGFMEAVVDDAGRLLQQFQINENVIIRNFTRKQVLEYQLMVDLEGVSFSVNVLEFGESVDDSVVVFLHGFLGTAGDWISVMTSLSRSARCIAIDLPGHGKTKFQEVASSDATNGTALSIEVVARMLCKLFHHLSAEKVILVGYSMGARIALYLALKCCDKVERAIIISGSPGLRDPQARIIRRSKDDLKACSLVSYGLELFLDAWYTEELWTSLRGHPHFRQIVANRLQHDDLHALAKCLSDLSVGSQPSLWEDLRQCELPLLLVIGERDAKFKKIAKEMCYEISQGTTVKDTPEIVEIPNSGHAVHLENPLFVIRAIRQFLRRKRGIRDER